MVIITIRARPGSHGLRRPGTLMVIRKFELPWCLIGVDQVPDQFISLFFGYTLEMLVGR